MNPTILGGVIGPGFLIRFLHYISLRPRQLSNLREDKGASIIIRIGFWGLLIIVVVKLEPQALF